MIIKDKFMAGADIRNRCAATQGVATQGVATLCPGLGAFALSGRAVCITIT